MEDYQSHRSGLSGFSVNAEIPGLVPNKSYKVRLGFSEVYKPNCEDGKRVMNIHVNDEVFVTGLDVYKESGCETALVLDKDFFHYD